MLPGGVLRSHGRAVGQVMLAMSQVTGEFTRPTMEDVPCGGHGETRHRSPPPELGCHAGCVAHLLKTEEIQFQRDARVQYIDFVLRLLPEMDEMFSVR